MDQHLHKTNPTLYPFCKKGYRYGFNGQEKVDEVAGEGNHNTALFWEYDTRTARRWNQDPKPNPSISNYACFAGNPIMFSDVLGDTIRDEKGNEIKYTKDKEGGISWSDNATEDVMKIGEAMMTTDIGSDAFNNWQESKNDVYLYYERENLPDDDAFASNVILKSGSQIVVLYEKKILNEQSRVGGVNTDNHFSWSSMQEAIGMVGTHEYYHTLRKQISLDDETGRARKYKYKFEYEQPYSQNYPLNSELTFRSQYQKKHVQNSNKLNYIIKQYSRRGYMGLDPVTKEYLLLPRYGKSGFILDYWK